MPHDPCRSTASRLRTRLRARRSTSSDAPERVVGVSVPLQGATPVAAPMSTSVERRTRRSDAGKPDSGALGDPRLR
jgi:hypothetical protein